MDQNCFLSVESGYLKETSINQMNFFSNTMSMIPSKNQVNLLEKKALVYLEPINETLSKRFNCTIRFMASGSIRERFGVPLGNYSIDNIGIIEERIALLSDQDFLIESTELIASYKCQSDLVEIVQSESCVE